MYFPPILLIHLSLLRFSCCALNGCPRIKDLKTYIRTFASNRRGKHALWKSSTPILSETNMICGYISMEKFLRFMKRLDYYHRIRNAPCNWSVDVENTIVDGYLSPQNE